MPADGGAAPAPIAPHPGRTTPLMYACSQGDLKQVKRILHDQPSSLQHLDRVHRTPLHYCAGGSTISVAPSPPAGPSPPPGARLSHCADLLLMAAPQLVHARDHDGFTPLHLAAIAGNVQLVQFLLANGADVKGKDNEMHSVVHWATVCGETAALQAVLAAGAEVSTPDVHGGYPIHYAAQMCGSEKPELGLQVLHILLSTPGITVSVIDNDGRQPLLWASSAGSARAVLSLVRAGAAVESCDKDGLTALHCAASRGHTDTLDTLLTLCGAQTDVIDSNGCTALHYSVTLGHADATALLLSHSADPNLQDRKGRSPAHCGCAKGQLETVRQLHAAGANLWLRTARGDLPLHEAAASGRRQLVKWLLDQRPSQVNARNNDGRGLLHLAALNDNADLCKILLDSGATVNPLLRTSKNIFMTPLDCALQRGFRSTAKFLQLHGGVPASRLNTLRLTSEVASNVSSGSHLHIREDVTVFGGSSSETELEDARRSKDHRGKRKTVRRKLSYRHERRRSYSGSDPEIESKVKGKTTAHEKRRSKSRDDAKSKDFKYSKHIEMKYDKRKKQQKFESEESASETETSPEIRKKKIEHRNGGPLNLEAARKTLASDAEKKKSKAPQEESNHEASDTEKSRKNTSDRERRKNNKQVTEEEPQTNDLKKKKKSSNGEEIVSPKDKIKKSSDTEKKSKKSDVSDSDTQKTKLSDSERKKKSAEKKAQKEKSIEEKINEEAEPKVEHENLKQKSQEEINSEAQNIEVSSEELLKSKIEDESHKQNVEATTKEDRKDSAKSTKPSSAKLTKQPTFSASKSDDTTENTSTETAQDTTLAQQVSEDAKHVEEQSESVQPDQISLQSKLSEGSPSKTIVVEAAVHHPPKGMSSVDVPTVTEENSETVEETSRVDGAEEAKIDSAQVVEDKNEPKLDQENGKVTEETSETQEVSVTKEASITKEVSLTKEDSVTKEEASTKEASTTESATLPEATESSSITEAAPITEASVEPKIEAEETVTSENKEVNNVSQEIDASASAEQKVEPETKVSADITETQAASEEFKQDEDATPSEETSTTVVLAGETSTKDETSLDQTTTETEEQKKEDGDSKKEINIDLSLKKFEESAEQNEATDIEEKTVADKETPTVEDHKQKKYRKKVKISKSKDVIKAAEDGESSSTSRETSSSENESEKSKKSAKNAEHKSFKVLRDDIAFEVLKDSPNKEKRVRKAKKRAKEAERLNESATSSPEMLESARTRSKSVPRQKELANQGITLPSLVEKRPESNLSAPNLSSVYSDNEQKSGSNSEADDLLSSASRKKRIKKRSKLRMGSKSAGSDYESSNLIDSGFEPSPRSSRIPKRKVMSERGVNMTSVTQQIQSNIRKYHMERKIFQHLLDLKRLQIRSGQANESVLVKRAIDNYHNSVAASVGAGRYLQKDFTYRSFEQFLYQSLRMLQKSPVDHMKGLPMTADNPLLCTQSTHRCLHATHAYTGIPCAAYLPKMNHHTMPKIGFTPRSTSSFLPQINSKGKSVTLELCHGNDKQVISLPADRLDHNKRYYVTFTVKGQDGPSPVDQENTTSHRHAKSV